MSGKPKITLVGAGSLASTLGPALHAAGYCIDEILSRDNAQSRRRARALARLVGARVATTATSTLQADVFWLCVSDGAISECARELAAQGDWRGRTAIHSSGALSSDELAALRQRGAHVASVHPMMTFVSRGRPSLTGVSFAFEGERAVGALARRMVRDLGGEMLTIQKANKPLYHALGAFGSPLLIMSMAAAEQVARAAGIGRSQAGKILQPLVRRTLDNYFARGAAASFSGPLVRGDVLTVARHLEQLSRVPEAREVYVSLVRSALRTLPVARKQEIRRLLR